MDEGVGGGLGRPLRGVVIIVFHGQDRGAVVATPQLVTRLYAHKMEMNICLLGIVSPSGYCACIGLDVLQKGMLIIGHCWPRQELSMLL